MHKPLNQDVRPKLTRHNHFPNVSQLSRIIAIHAMQNWVLFCNPAMPQVYMVLNTPHPTHSLKIFILLMNDSQALHLVTYFLTKFSTSSNCLKHQEHTVLEYPVVMSSHDNIHNPVSISSAVLKFVCIVCSLCKHKQEVQPDGVRYAG
ncbi:TPA: hypothetical protein ACH3X1_015383 [Trebouxia sp. C0004]